MYKRTAWRIRPRRPVDRPLLVFIVLERRFAIAHLLHLLEDLVAVQTRRERRGWVLGLAGASVTEDGEPPGKSARSGRAHYAHELGRGGDFACALPPSEAEERAEEQHEACQPANNSSCDRGRICVVCRGGLGM